MSLKDFHFCFGELFFQVLLEPICVTHFAFSVGLILLHRNAETRVIGRSIVDLGSRLSHNCARLRLVCGLLLLLLLQMLFRLRLLLLLLFDIFVTEEGRGLKNALQVVFSCLFGRSFDGGN